ncbi:type II and III secretion system protein family protein [Vibrio europaeus]|uniref:Type II and III secretion system protein family protein n=1 Tax=Vibrio europaeus TaxID=300876 RepID=A0AAE7AX67_9VIBR|nr:type II and III secretion system protein family protein [Vibrio europaeus]MDC5811948.1 type II and III secretion system protein family protein [Vibrio europaeus]QJY38383.1 type II and III secretion system protein family protein [Vibrio europaeus]QPG33399.1 type II and III secretion system protein family protein [Vibrio europaeus]
MQQFLLRLSRWAMAAAACISIPAWSAGLSIAMGDASSVSTEQEIGTIFVSSPDVADYQILDSHKFVVFGKQLGDTRIMVFAKDNSKIYDRKVNVVRDVSLVNRQLKLHYPDLKVKVEAVDEQVLATGEIINQTQQQEVVTLIGELLKLKKKETGGKSGDSGSSKGGSNGGDVKGVKADFIKKVEYDGLVDKLKIASADQINVKLSIADVSRTLNEELGFKWGSEGAGAAGQFLLTDFDAGKLSTLISAIDDNSLGQMLAEPNLSVISGESATFLVGGELPVVTSSANGSSVQYKEYGIKLAFAAKSLESGRIRLKLKPEVSSVDQTYSGANNFMPALRTRKAETTLELKDGESFVIGGLMSSEEVEGMSKIPGAGDIPVLGALFRSAATKREKRELVIVATVNRVKPQHASEIQLPHMQPTGTFKRLFGLSETPKYRVTYDLLFQGGFKK